MEIKEFFNMADNKVYLVTNRSAGEVVYAIPDMGIKMRSF
jgi:hypothetical protein